MNQIRFSTESNLIYRIGRDQLRQRRYSHIEVRSLTDFTLAQSRSAAMAHQLRLLSSRTPNWPA